MSSNKKFMVKITPKHPQGGDGFATALKPSITFDMSKPFRLIKIGYFERRKKFIPARIELSEGRIGYGQ